jgi:putative nucleotidyltransferase with HDIG domain
LKTANAEMVQAYDATLEGWSRALELRDQQTDGHSRRVSELAVCLGRAMGMDEAQLLQVRRGALLHDIGKVGIPDNILVKPGPLTEEEWDIMKRHASYGYELLMRIPFLQEALAIPYCHHERWDGTGYPRGLKGEEIPLAARIFAVIDVWDALCSDRPYRKAWPEHEARAYIRSLSGAHFDPKVVDAFLRLVV